MQMVNAIYTFHRPRRLLPNATLACSEIVIYL